MADGKIFINYRRDDAQASAGRLFDRLEGHFGADRLFFDVDDIPPGVDFVAMLREQVDACDVMLSIVGRRWLDAQRPDGGRRLDDPNDFVRIEIEAALADQSRLIPVLVDGAPMPSAHDVPEGLVSFTRRNAVRLTHERFTADVQGLIRALDSALEAAEADRKTEAVRRAAAEEERRREAEEEAARSAEAQRQALIAARTTGLSPSEIAKAEELGNWEYIKESGDAALFRDHLARYPDGVSEPWARTKFEALAWAEAASRPTRTTFEAYLDTFPEGPNADEARRLLEDIVANERAEAEALRRREEAETVWRAIIDTNDAATVQAFLADFPDSPHAAEARRLARALSRTPEHAQSQTLLELTSKNLSQRSKVVLGIFFIPMFIVLLVGLVLLIGGGIGVLLSSAAHVVR